MCAGDRRSQDAAARRPWLPRFVLPEGSPAVTSAPGLGPPLPHPVAGTDDRFSPSNERLSRGVGIRCARRSAHATALCCRGVRTLRPPPDEDINFADTEMVCHICTGTGLTPATSAPGLGSPLPHLHRDWAHPGHICTATWLIPAIFTGTGLAPATSALGLGSFLPHLHQDWAHSCHICGTRLAAATSAGTGSRYRSSFAASSTASHRTTSQSRKGSRTRCISAHRNHTHDDRSSSTDDRVRLTSEI
jgi:hypothetical protein